MLEAAVGYIGEEVLLAGVAGTVARPRGNRHEMMAPHNAFRCKDEGGRMKDEVAGSDRTHPSSFRLHPSDSWIAIAVRDDRDWAALLAVAGDAPRLHEPRFATAAGRLAAEDELERAVGEWTARHDARGLMERLQACGVPAGVVQDNLAVLSDPHLRARGWYIPLSHPDTGEQVYQGFAWRFSGTTLAARPAPRLGEHSAAVLREVLGMGEAEVALLVAEGVIGEVLEVPVARAGAV
jgi:crotonobetainyl-CoA:carnitine CoA-transferase CaiB-like acyl-CoA transferase